MSSARKKYKNTNGNARRRRDAWARAAGRPTAGLPASAAGAMHVPARPTAAALRPPGHARLSTMAPVVLLSASSSSAPLLTVAEPGASGAQGPSAMVTLLWAAPQVVSSATAAQHTRRAAEWRGVARQGGGAARVGLRGGGKSGGWEGAGMRGSQPPGVCTGGCACAFGGRSCAGSFRARPGKDPSLAPACDRLIRLLQTLQLARDRLQRPQLHVGRSSVNSIAWRQRQQQGSSAFRFELCDDGWERQRAP